MSEFKSFSIFIGKYCHHKCHFIQQRYFVLLHSFFLLFFTMFCYYFNMIFYGFFPIGCLYIISLLWLFYFLKNDKQSHYYNKWKRSLHKFEILFSLRLSQSIAFSIFLGYLAWHPCSLKNGIVTLQTYFYSHSNAFTL